MLYWIILAPVFLHTNTDARTYTHALTHARARTHTHTEICNTYCFSMATVVSLTRFNVTLYVRASLVKYIFPIIISRLFYSTYFIEKYTNIYIYIFILHSVSGMPCSNQILSKPSAPHKRLSGSDSSRRELQCKQKTSDYRMSRAEHSECILSDC